MKKDTIKFIIAVIAIRIFFELTGFRCQFSQSKQEQKKEIIDSVPKINRDAKTNQN
jgi:hypothetical protein